MNVVPGDVFEYLLAGKHRCYGTVQSVVGLNAVMIWSHHEPKGMTVKNAVRWLQTLRKVGTRGSKPQPDPEYHELSRIGVELSK
jgi:hypothetical protein